MARPIKKGLDYFPKDTGSFGDRKIRRLLKEFGCKGYVIYDCILCEVYREEGYFVNYDDDISFDIADQLGVDQTLVHEVVTGCIRMGLFDKNLFDVSKILTSHRIQNTYRLAKRNGVIATEMEVFATETGINADEIEVNAAESTQSKVKEIKVNKSKRKQLPHLRKNNSELPLESGNPPIPRPPLYKTEEHLEQELTEIDVGGFVQYAVITCHVKDVSGGQIRDYWQAFKIQHFTGGKTYSDFSECKSHFLNWLKFKLNNGKDTGLNTGSGGGTSSNRVEALQKW